MSDLQDLIHKTSMDCLAKGKQQEQERIIKLLKKETFYGVNGTLEFSDKIYTREELIALIKGEINE